MIVDVGSQEYARPIETMRDDRLLKPGPNRVDAIVIVIVGKAWNSSSLCSEYYSTALRMRDNYVARSK
jgi:hypothetical protein